MFTGIIQEVGELAGINSARGGAEITLAVGKLAGELAPGDSLAVQGVCLTVTGLSGSRVSLDVSTETLARTTLGGLRVGASVNLEPALRLSDRLGGHLVTGHVDAVARVLGFSGGGKDTVLRFGFPSRFSRYMVEKGSVALDGISLTLARVDEGAAEAHLVPATLAGTSLKQARPGDSLNLETDILGKYVEKMMPGGGGITWESLSAAGLVD